MKNKLMTDKLSTKNCCPNCLSKNTKIIKKSKDTLYNSDLYKCQDCKMEYYFK